MSTNSKVKVEHRRLGEGYITVAFNYNADLEVIHYGLSFCSPLDQFSRKRGNLIAKGRLETYSGNDAFRAEKLIARGLAGAIKANTEPKKRAVIDNVIGLVTTRELPEDMFRWVQATTTQ
jgi:hypothetical protein